MAYSSSYTKKVLNGTYEPSLPKKKKKQEEVKEEKKWYQKITQAPETFKDNLDRFDDGYNFGDITGTIGESLWDAGKTAVGTVADIGTSAVKGVADIGQGVAKLGAGGVAQIADWIGEDDYAEKVRNRIAGKDKETNELLNKYSPSGIMQNWNDKVEGSSFIGETGDKVFESVGYIGGIAATGGLAGSGVATATMFGNSAGNALGESYQKENVEDWQAWTKAIGSGAVETVSERLFGIFGTSGLDKAVANRISSKLTSGMAKVLARQGIQATGEALEEFLSYAGNQGLDLVIDKANEVTGGTGANFKEDWNWEDLGEQMATAFLASGIIGAGSNVGSISNIKSQTGMSTNEAINELGRREDIQAEIEDITNEVDKLEKKLVKEKDQAKANEINQQIAEKIAHKQELESILQPATNVQEDIAPVQEQQVNTIDNVQDIDSQIEMLETQLMATENEAEYQRLSEQIRALEDRANQLEQQGDIAPVQAQVNEQAQNEDIAPFKMANVEETQQPTTQEVNSNSLVEVESNTQNNPETQLSEALIKEIQYKTAKANENKANVKMVSTNEVVTDGRNGGYRTQEQVSKLTEDIKRNGIVTPIEVKVENGKVEVVDGNHRLSIAKELGLKEVPVVYVTDNMENIDNSQDILYNNENKSSLDYVEGEFESGNRNGSDVDKGNVRSESNQKNSANNNVTSENEGTTREHDKVSKKVQRDNDGPSSASTSKQNTTPTQAELDNLEYTRKNKSGSEYASAFYDLGKKYGTTNLYKALNNYKSTGLALEEIAPVKQELDEITQDLKETIKDTKKEIKTLKKELNEAKSTINELVEESKALTEADLPYFENLSKEALEQDIAPTRNNLTMEESQELDALEDSTFGLTLEEEARLRELSATENNSFNMQDTISMDKKSLKALSKNIKDILGLNKAQTTELENAIQEYMTQETATKTDLHRIIDSKFGKQSVETKIGEVTDIQRVVRQTKIKPTDDLRQMTDYFQMKQKNFGKVSMSNSGMSVDKAYQELSGMYPDFFPGDITNSADQFERIIEVANMDKVINEDVILPEETIQDVTDFVYESVQDYKYSEYVKMAEQEYQQGLNVDIAPYEPTIEETTEIAPVQEQYEAIEPAPVEEFDNGGPMLRVSPEMEQKTLNKNIEKKDVNWEALEDTSKGEQQALIKKKLGDTLTPINTNLDNVEDTSKGTQKQYNPETGQLEDSIEKKTKKQIKQELLEQTGILNASLDEANKLPKILMENTDPIRLQEMIFGRGLGTDINNMFFQKVKDNTSEKIRFQNKERAEIKELGIKARSKESAAVQKYGEKQYVNEKTGEVLPYGDRELASEFPNMETQQKIKRASRIIRQKYDKYLDTTNEVLTKLGYDPIPKRPDYMRHFQELNDIFSRVGIPYNYNEMTANDLPTDINGLTADFSPSKNFFASALQRKGVKTTYDAITGIDGYLEGVGNLIYHTEDIQRLRAFEQYIRDTYGENHGFDNLEKLTDEEKAERIEKIQDNHLSNYASWLHEYTNTLAGKKALIDRSIEGLTGRKIYSFLNTTKTQVGRNMIGFNLSSAMTNIVAEVQALAKTNKLATIKGLADTVKNIFVKDGFVEKNNFLTSRFGSDMLSKNLWQKAGDAGFIFMQGTDNFISQMIVRSKYNELKSKGYTDEQAHIESGKFASRIMGDRSQGATANIYNSQMLGLVTQFQLEVNNQLYSMFYDTYHESKEVAKGNAAKTAVGMTFTLGQLAVLTHLFGAGFEAMAGYNPTFDILGMLMKAFGLDDEDEEETTAENISQAFKQLVDALPYVNILTGGGRIPVSEAFTGVTDTFKALTGGKDEYGQDIEWSDAWDSIKESAPYFLLPSGYSQIKKTTKGLGMYDEDLPIAGSYTDSGNLRFMADDSNWGKIQAGLFGQWATDEAQEYIDSEFKSISSTDIDEMLDLGMISSEYRDYKTGLSKSKGNDEKLDYINSLNVTDEQKTIMANNVLDRDYDVDMSIYDNFGSYEEFDYYYKYPEKYALGSAITDFKDYLDIEDHIWDLKADKDEEGNSITGTRKAKVIEYVNSLDLDIPQKAMLIREEYSSFDDYNYEIIEYVDGLDRDYEEKMKILEALNMKVEEDGTVSW